MDVLLLVSDAYVQERYREIEAEQRTPLHKMTQPPPEHEQQRTKVALHDAEEELTLASLARVMCADSQDDEVLLAKWCALQQRMYQERADSLDAKWPTSHLERKLVVLRAALAELYRAERITAAMINKQKAEMRSSKAHQKADAVTTASKIKSLEDGTSPLSFEDLPLATQLGLRIFFRFCQSLHEPSKLAESSRVLLQVALRLPALLAALPTFPLSPGFFATLNDARASAADQSSMYDSSDSPKVLSVFQSLFGLLSDLLHLPSRSTKAPSSTTNSSNSNTSTNGSTAAAGILSSSDRSTVLTAYIALCLKWGSLRHLLSVIVMLLDGDANMVTPSQFQQLELLFADVAYSVPEASSSALQQADDSCCGYLMSFGKGDHGKLGHGQCSHASCAEGNCTENKNSPTMISATRDTQFAKIDSLSTHSVAITTQGEVMAWGNGDKYRLGHGTAAKEYTPRGIESLSMKGGGVRVMDISCGLGHTIALMESGELFSWGNGSNGRLGLGDTTDRITPTKILTSELHSSGATQANAAASGMLPARLGSQLFRHVYCGASHSLAIGFDGRAYAWGKNNQGQCGHGHTNDQLTIQEVKFFRNEVDEDIVHAAGGWEHTLFCSASGRVYSAGCGYKDSRRTGIPPVLGHGDCERRIKPTVVQFFIDSNDVITKVACGWDHSLAVTATGLVYSWGSGTNGKLGHGDEENCNVPTLITEMEGKQVKIAKAGCEHTVLLTDEHEVWSFGQGDSGRLGHGDNLTRKVPTRIEAFSQSGLRPVAIAVGDKYNLVLVEDLHESSDMSHGSSGSKHHSYSPSPSSSSPLGGRSGLEHHHRKRRSSLLRCELEKRRCIERDAYFTSVSSSRYEADWVLAVGENLQKQMLQAGEQKLSDSSKAEASIMEIESGLKNNAQQERLDTGENQVEQQELLFLPQSRSACILYLLGHIDRLAAAYFSENKDKFFFISDGCADASNHDDDDGDRNAPLLLPFAIDTSREAFVLLLRILRLQCQSTVSSGTESVIAAGDGSRSLMLQRMCVALSCLRILKSNLSKSLQAGRHSFATKEGLLQRGKPCLGSELEAVNTLDEIHYLINQIASAGAQGILELFGGTRSAFSPLKSEPKTEIQSQKELLSIANAVSQEAARVLQVGFVAFYPLPANRRELLWELTSQVSGADNSIQGMKALVLADRTCEADVMKEIFLHAFALESSARNDSKHRCVGGSTACHDRDSAHIAFLSEENGDMDNDKCATELVNLMITLVKRSSVEAVSHLEADTHQHSQTGVPLKNDARLHILAVLQVHLFGLATSYLSELSPSNHFEGHQSSILAEQQPSTNGVICSCVVDALLLYLDALFAESTIVLKKLHKASCQHEEVVTWRLNGSFFHSLLPSAIESLCVLLSQANRSLTSVALDRDPDHGIVESQLPLLTNLGLRLAHRLLPHAHPMLKMLDEVNWKMQHNQSDNQTRHEFNDETKASLETRFENNQNSRRWVLELQDACGVLCGKLACVAATFKSAPASMGLGTEDSEFNMLKAKLLSADVVCPSATKARLDTMEIHPELTEILQWERNGVFEVENELEQSDNTSSLVSSSGQLVDAEQLTRDQRYLIAFIADSSSSVEQLALWIAADEVQEDRPAKACAPSGDGCRDLRLERPMRAIIAVVIWNCSLVDEFQRCYDGYQGIPEGGISNNCSDTSRESDIKRRQILQRLFQRVTTLGEFTRDAPSSAAPDELADTVTQNVTFLLTLRPSPLQFSAVGEVSSNSDVQQALLSKLIRLVTEPAGFRRWEAIVSAQSIDTALFRIGLCFFHDLLRKLTIPSTKSYLLGELITTMRSATGRAHDGTHRGQLRMQEDSSSQQLILKSIENLYIRLAKIISADESSPSLKEKALVAWAIPLEELTLSADAAADVIAKAGITNVIGDLFVDDVGILETHAALNQYTENSPLSGQDGAHASPINSGDCSWALASQRLKPVMSLLFLQTSSQSLRLISWTALCAVALQLNQSSLATHRNDNPLLGPGPAASLSASISVSTRSMSGKDYTSPRTAVSPRKRLTLPKRTIVSTVSDSVDQVYELLFVMLTKVKQEFDIQSSHAEKMSRLLATDSEPSSSPLTSSKQTLSRERGSSKDEVSQELLLGNPVPISSTTRHIINRSKHSGTSARLKGDATTIPAAPCGLTISAWIYIEHTGAAAVVTAENSTQLPLENIKRLSESPVLFALGSSEHETKAGVTTENDGRSASSDAILAESELIVFTHRVASKRVALTIALKRESKPAPGQSSMTNFDADNQVEVTGRRTVPSSWEILVLSEDVHIGQWIHVAIVFQGAQNTWTAFFDGKRVGATEWTTRDTLLSSESLPSKLRRLSVGGKLSEKDIAIIGAVEEIQDMQTETRSQEHEIPNASSKKPHFEGVLDDVLVLDSPLGDQDITWLSRQGPVLFQLKRQHIAESHCADLLQLLCQLVQRERTGLNTGEQAQHSITAAAAPLSTRWAVLFAELLDKFPNDMNGQQHHVHDHVQVLLCELLQQTLPEIAPSALAEATISSIFEGVFSHLTNSQESNEPKLNRTSIYKVYLEHNGIPNGSSSSRRGDLTRNETLQMLMHDRRLGFEDFSHGSRCDTESGLSKRCSKGTSSTQDAIAQPLLKLTSLSIAADVRLFQSLWKSSVWRAEIEGHIERAASAFLQTERAMASDSKPAISKLAAMCSALGGYCEVTINESKAASMKTAPSLALSVFSRMESPFSSTMSLQDACGDASSASNPTLSLFRAAFGSVLALCGRGGSARSTLDDYWHEGTLKTSKELHASDHYVMMMVHSRASLLRFVAKASRESSDLFWQHAVESSQSSTLVEQLFHLASTPSFEFICATLGPDHKKALRLRSIRALLHDLLQMPHGKQKAEISHSFSSLPQIEVLAWKAWEFCFDRPRYDKMNGPSWWQQKKKHSHSLLETMGGEVMIHNTTATALEHFATVRLGGNVAIAANSGLWFYEVTMLTDGLMQIGYIDADFVSDPVQGQGVGDHASSWAFDGYRCKKWNVSSSDYGEAWRAEDVIGVLLDTDRMELSFFLNGKFLGVAFSGIPMTQTSRMCPAASINVDQAAQFNFGSSLLTPETSSQDQQQQNTDRLLAFAHSPVLDSEQDQSRLQPVALAISRPSSNGTSKRRRNLSSASKSTNDLTSEGEESAAKNGLSDDQSETNEDEGDAAVVAQSTDDEEDDDDENDGGGGGGTVDVASESFGLRLPNATLFGDVADDDDSNDRDSRSRENAVAAGGSSDAVEDDALAARRNDLIDGLTGLGFPREWAIRCAIETNLSIHESGAVSWILEQMEKDAATSSDSANLRSSAEGGDVAGRQNTLFGDLPSNIRSADDLMLLTSSASLGGGNFTLALPSAHHQPYGLYSGMAAAQGFRPHTEHLPRNRLELFCELQTAAKPAPSPSSSSTVHNAERSSSSVQTRATNLYLLAEQEDVDIDEDLSSSMELMYCREYNGKGLEQLITAARLALPPSKKPISVADKGPQDRAYCQSTADTDDSIPLCLTLDSLVTVLYARHALFDLLTSDRNGEEHTRQVLHFVSNWCLKADSLRRLVRFLKTLVGVENHEPVTGSSTQMLTGASDLLQTSSKLQRTFRALVTMESQEFCKTRVNVCGDTVSGAEQQQKLPVYHALFNEMRDQCIQSLTFLRGNAKKNQSTTASSVGLSAAWVLWLAGIVFPIADSFVQQHTGQTQTDAAVALGSVFASTCFSLSFVQTLVAMASGASFVTLPWKIVSFTMMKRVLCGISRSQPPVVEGPSTLSGRSWASNPLKTFECAAQMHNLLDLFALRHRKENTGRVFFSSLTQAIFGLLVRHVESISSCQRTASSCAQVSHDHEARDLSHVNNAGLDFFIEALSSSFATVSWTQSSQDQDTSDDDGSNAGVENTVLSLSVSPLPDSFHNDVHGANDHPPRVLPSKGTYTIRNLVPDTRYVLRLSPVQTMVSLNSASQEAVASTADAESGLPSEPLRTLTATNAPSTSSPFCRELRFQTPPEPLFQLNAESMGKNLTLLNRNLSVKNLVNKKWHTVRASVGFDEGVHQWHVRIDTCVSKNIFIGVCTSQASMENYIGSDGFGYGFLANKAVWHNKSKLHSYGEIFKQGDLLQVTLDCNAKTLAFSRNGEYLGIAATNLHAAVGPGSSYASSSSLLLSTSESSKWYPAFSMYNKDDQLTIIPPSSATMLANSARQQQQQQHASILELVEAMQVVNAYQQSTSASAASEATGNVSCFAGVHPLYTAAFKDFYRWKRGAILFRERELGHFMRIDASENATQRFGFFKRDAVFTSRGQATVLGEGNHELWYECDNSGSNSSEQHTGPGLDSWSLHACKQMLASPSEFTVHRHTRSHHHHRHQYLDHPPLDSSKHSDEKPLDNNSDEKSMAITAEAFEEYQKQWTHIPCHEALDAKLIEILDGIAASRVLSDPQCLSFGDISAAFLIDKVIASPLLAMLENSGAELSMKQIMARIGLLLYVNRSLCRVIRLVLAEPAPASKWSLALFSKSRIASNPRAKRETEATDDEAKDKSGLSDDAKKRNAYVNAVVASDFIAGLVNSPQSNPSDPSRFTSMEELATRLLFQAQKAKLMSEAMQKTATATLNSLVNSDLEIQNSELTSSARDESYDPSDLPRMYVRYPARDGNHCVPFWSDLGADPLRKSSNKETVFLVPEEGNSRRHRSLFLQVSQQLQKLDPRELRRTYATPFEPLPITRTFHTIVTESTSGTGSENTSSKKAKPSTLFESLDLEHKASLGDGEEGSETSCPQQQTVFVSKLAAEIQQQSQASQYVKLLEDVMRELQSPDFPLFIPLPATTSLAEAGEQPARCTIKSKPVELDVNTALFSPSVAAHCQLSSEQLLLWFVHFGQLLGIAWRSGVLLPLQFISLTFWQELVDIPATNHCRGGVRHDERHRPIVLEAIRDGLFSIVPSRCVVSLLTPAQVRSRLCDPHTHATLERIKRHAQYDTNAEHHTMFWDIVESFTAVERVALLGFLTGSSNNRWTRNHDSVQRFEFMLEISSDPLTVDSGDQQQQQQSHPDACYPVVVSSSDIRSTRLYLPAYSSMAAMRKKLVLAMTSHCSGL